LEFNEKLQQLRKQKELTQEQLAEQLYVSRTAISKWESGKGYPNIESLKCIAKLFSVSIDELLSGEELITLAETENRSNLGEVYSLIYGVLDLMLALCIFLPLYGKSEGSYIRAVNLMAFTDTTRINLIIYWVIFVFMIGLGITQLIFVYFEKESWRSLTAKCSIGLQIFAICFFAAAREPYVTTLVFLLFVMKLFILIKESRTK
jgi:transcriptional regulator with XRE-family HTH domain